jgi:hypothetical protein
MKLIKLFIPPFVYVFFSLLRGLKGRISLKGIPYVKYNSGDRKSIYIVGNGPSLNESLKTGLEILQSNECMVVNRFVSSSLFESLKPSSYLLVDPVFSCNPDSCSDRLKEIIIKTTNDLVNKVKWDMTLYLPVNAYRSYLVNKISVNNCIHLVFFNNKGSYSGFPPKLYYWLLNHNCIAPLAQTVLNSCLSLAITMRYSNIFIVGADTSWHEDYWMDQKTNFLYTIDKHFYGEEKVRLFKDANHTCPTRIHEEFRNISTALGSYWLLADYARYNKVNVFNASSYSWIDAFERRALK